MGDTEAVVGHRVISWKAKIGVGGGNTVATCEKVN
jgi:hypothetical protein